MGGPSDCCGVMQLRAGDAEMSGRMGANSIEKLSHSKSGQVISWCPSCYVQFTETTLPTMERQHGSRPFEMTPFMRFLDGRLAQLKPHLQQRVEMRVALHQHPGVAGVMEAGVDALVTVYHSEHRELCAHERDWPFRIVNVLELVGESMGLHRQDRYKQLKILQDADQIVSECGDLIAQHALDPGKARDVVVKAMLGDQPLPLGHGSHALGAPT